MTEDNKEKKDVKCACAKPATMLKVILGLVLIVLGALAFINWWWHFLVVVKGCLGPFLILAGLVTFAIAKE
ncbi:hypothetical protein ACFL1E_07280 [Candidatus Omnitrophota bacterium]